MATELQGVFQTDIILRTAIIQAIRDLRANPQLLDYVFASLPQDSLTASTYGDKEVQRAKEWFMRTEISVHLQPRLDESKVPSISIKLIDSSEVENTLGDIHYQPMEDTDGNYWPPITGQFTPEYEPTTGTITVPDSVDIILVPGMFIVDTNGVSHEILTADGSTLTIEPVTADFTNAVIKGTRPGLITELESVVYKETYQIGVHVSSEPVYLTWLHSIVVFALLRYKERFLEARGLERTIFSSSDFDINSTIEQAEFTFSRYMSMTGYVRHSWPKDSFGRIEAVVPQFITIDGQAPLAVGTDGQLPVSLAWGSSGTVPAGGDCCDNLPDASTTERGLMTPSQLNQLNATTDIASSARTSAIAASAAAAAAQTTADNAANAAAAAQSTADTAQSTATAAQSTANTALATANAAVPATRTISTTSPLTGGGALSSNLTISAPDASTSSGGFVNTGAQVFAGAKAVLPVALLSSGGSIATDLNAGNNFTHTTTESTVLANPTNVTAGISGRIAITQGVTPRTMTFGSYWKFPGGVIPTLTASAGAVDVLVFEVISPTFIAASLLKGFA